jgi:toxin ParE1/3/4
MSASSAVTSRLLMPSHRQRIIYTRSALGDISEILAYTSRTWGEEQRQRYLTHLRDTFRRLTSMPSLGRGQDGLFPGLRSYPVESHIVYYLYEDGGVLIVRVLHSRQDASSIDWASLADEPEDTL